MLFYKVTSQLDDKNMDEENDDRISRMVRARQIARKTEDYNDRYKQDIYSFVSYIGYKEVICGIISQASIDALKIARSFLKSFGIAAKDPDVSEITFSSMQNLISEAERCDFIRRGGDIFEQFDLNRIRGFNRGVEYGENLLCEETDKLSLYEMSKRLLAEETLNPELDRIYTKKKKCKAFGHPVHYILETDGSEARKELSRTLLQALFDKDRIKSRRYCFIDFKPGQDFSRIVYDALYNSCVEGAIVVRYYANDDSDDNGGYANSEMETISALCEAMMKYRNQVLTIFCLPRACEKTKKVFYENLGSIGIVEIREDLADIEKSTGYLKMLCKDKHIRHDKKLFCGLEADKQYLPDELRTIFNDWYNEKMKTTVFSQYKDINVCRDEAVKEVARGNAYDDLNEMIGLSDAKSVIGKALGYYKIQHVYKDKGIKQDRPAMHMVFTGNPGTAKTTVARLFARIMKENGLLSRGHLVEVGRSDLVGKYVGWTAQIVKEKFKSAMGGVLFIDEAYSLANENSGSYGQEAIDTIVQEMENRREDLVVIFAGYPDEMEFFLDKNPGLRSRIAFHVPFADYSTEELCDIARMIGKTKGVSFTDEAMEKIFAVLDNARLQEDFGNGRYVRNLIELSKMNQACRILKKDPDELSDTDLTLIEDVDIDAPLSKPKPKINSIGFVI